MATTTILLTLAALGHDDDTNVPEPADDTIAPDPMTTLGRAASRSTGGN
jgi:multicomponent Na+:H+ antiporter subunit C